MSTESNKAVVRRFRDALHAGDLDGAIAVFAPNAVVHVSGAPDPLTMEGVKQLGEVLLSAFPGGTGTTEDMTGVLQKSVERQRKSAKIQLHACLARSPSPSVSILLKNT
jgi:ketosteroid isomerase-like protein